MKKVFVLSALAFAIAFTTAPANAKCQINLKVKNTGTQKMSVNSSTRGGGNSAVRVMGGSWRELGKGSWHIGELSAGNSKSDVYKASMKCKKYRKYRIKYYCKEGKETIGTHVKYTSYYRNKTSVAVNLSECR